MWNFVSAKKLLWIKEIIELWEVKLQRANCDRINVYQEMDGCNWCDQLMNSFGRRDDCKCLFQRNLLPSIKIRSGLLKCWRSTQNALLQALLCNNSTSEIEASIKYAKVSVKYGNIIICHFTVDDCLELFPGFNTVTFKEKLFFNNIYFLDHRHFFLFVCLFFLFFVNQLIWFQTQYVILVLMNW